MRSMFYSVNNCFKYKRKPWNLIFIDVRWIANVDAQELNGCLTAASRDRAGFASPVFEWTPLILALGSAGLKFGIAEASRAFGLLPTLKKWSVKRSLVLWESRQYQLVGLLVKCLLINWFTWHNYNEKWFMRCYCYWSWLRKGSCLGRPPCSEVITCYYHDISCYIGALLGYMYWRPGFPFPSWTCFPDHRSFHHEARKEGSKQANAAGRQPRQAS